MKLDISSRKDIKCILILFYEKLLADEKMAPFFEEIVVNKQLDHHLEIITDFWQDILFDTTLYKNNTMKTHTPIDMFFYPLRRSILPVGYRIYLRLLTLNLKV
tara:strand:+ start:615 stop:923 length:309 start_codon:yes stop_codon:yes gene_type:complete